MRLLDNKTSNGDNIVAVAELSAQGLVVNSSEAFWAETIQGLPILCEHTDRLVSRKPSSEVLNRIERTFEFWTKDRRLRISTAVSAIIFLLLIGGSVWAAKLAANRSRQAHEQTQLAKQARDEAAVQSNRAATAAKDAEQQAVRAEDARQKAESETIRAATATKQASYFSREAQQQQHIAEARKLSNEAALMLEQHPEALVESAARALRATKLDPSAESDETLRAIDDMLPTEEAVVWDVFSGRELLRLDPMAGDVRSVLLSPDSKRVAVMSYSMKRQSDEEGSVVLCDLASGQKLLSLSGTGMHLRSVSFSFDSKRLATTSVPASRKRTNATRGRATVWDLATGKEVFSVPDSGVSLVDASLSRDGKRLITVDYEGISVWYLEGGKLLFAIGYSSQEGIWIDAFSADRERIATAPRDGNEVTVWDLKDGVQISTLRGHSGALHDIAFSPDSTCLATASEDKSAKIWDTLTGQELQSLLATESMLKM